MEEPESHLYPESQQAIGEVLGLFHNQKNAVLVTTHSPYLLGTFNYMLLASQTGLVKEAKAKTILHKQYWLARDSVSAYYIHDGVAQSAINNDSDLFLIRNELIDQASERINANSDGFIELTFTDSEESTDD